MKVHRKQLLAALREAKTVTSARAPTPILRCVRLTGEGAGLVVEATDLDVTARRKIPAHGELAPAVVDRAGLETAIKAVRAPDVELRIENPESLRVSHSAGSATLPALPADKYPGLPLVPGDPLATLDAAELRAALAWTLRAASSDATRPNLCGVYFKPGAEAGRIHAVATDGHRLHAAALAPLAQAQGAQPATLPTLGLQCVAERIGKVAGSVCWTTGPRHGTMLHAFTAPGWAVSMRAIAGEYPHVSQVIPGADAPVLVACDTSELRAALESVSRWRVNKREPWGCEVTFDHHAGAVVIAWGGNESPGVASVPAVVDAELPAMGFNAHYLLDALPPGDRVAWTFAPGADRALSPILLAAPGPVRPSQFAVVMPMRL